MEMMKLLLLLIVASFPVITLAQPHPDTFKLIAGGEPYTLTYLPAEELFQAGGFFDPMATFAGGESWLVIDRDLGTATTASGYGHFKGPAFIVDSSEPAGHFLTFPEPTILLPLASLLLARRSPRLYRL
jgi:hypothetical protein